MFRMLVTSDWHTGNKVGLTPPRKWDADNREYLEPPWEFFSSACKQIGKVDLHVALGDLVDGPNEKNPENLLEPDLNQQIAMAVEIMEVPRARHRRIVKGTGYHADRHCSLEEFVAKELQMDAEDDIRIKVHGRRIHLRHVVGRSDVPYGQYGQDAKEMINEILQAEQEEYESADLIGRAHVHYCTTVGQVGPDRKMRYVWTNPALQMRGPVQSAFTRRLRTWLYHVGVMLVEIDKTGEVLLRPIIFPLKHYMRREYECLTGEA